MKAFVLRSYGSPEVLDLVDIGTPVPADDEVLVRVRATSANPYDWHSMRGERSLSLEKVPYLVLGGGAATGA